MYGRSCLTLCVLALILFAPPVRRGLADSEPAGEGITAITAPSKDVTLSFVQPGQIDEIMVKQGDVVGKGQLLASQRDQAEQTELARIKAQSEDTTQIKAAKAKLEQKKVDLEKFQWAAERGSATDLEVEHARLDVKIAEFSYQLAQFEHRQYQYRYEAAKFKLEQKQIKSPIAGRVEKINVEKSESVDALEDMMRVVRISPLWIDVPVPLEVAGSLKDGSEVSVRFGEPDATTATGKVIFIASVADAASNTLTIRVEVPNSGNRPAGEHVRVFFPDEN